MYRIGKSFTFAAAHHLPQLPDTHKCHRPHGHNYVVTYTLASRDLDSNGFIVDYAELTAYWKNLEGTLDHRDLNQIFRFPPTAENLARWLYENSRGTTLPVESVRVQETPTTFAEYTQP